MNNAPLEQTIFEEGEVIITNSRTIIGAKTFAMSNITSVSMSRKDPSSCLPVTIFILSILAVIASVIAIIFDPKSGPWSLLIGGAIVAGVSYLLLRSSRSTFFVQIGSASGEMNALGSTDEAYIRRIVNAMNEAIVKRG